jgi:D-psicose/D-tagatose/L-ribulose 3-epimerase
MCAEAILKSRDLVVESGRQPMDRPVRGRAGWTAGEKSLSRTRGRRCLQAVFSSPNNMRFGINTFLFVSPFTTESTKLFAQFKKWGFDTVEIPIEDPSHIDPAKLKAAAAKAGIAIGSVCAAMGPGRDFRGTAEEQKTAMDYCVALIDQAAAMGCPSLIGPVYSVVGKADAVEPAQQKVEWDLVVKNLKQLARHAEAKGVTICIEPLNRFETDFLNTCDQGLKLIKAVGSKAVKLHLDTFHMNIEEKFQADAIRKAGKLLGHFHACGSDRGTPGGDHIDWPSIAKALKAVGYKGDVVIESFTTDVKVIARAAAIWRKIEPKRNDIAVNGLKFLRKNLR